jgi:hypothetical protein
VLLTHAWCGWSWVQAQEGQPEDVELRKGWPWWKLKKWVLHVVNRMFSRFGNAKVVKGDHQKAFATMFSKEWAGRFLQSFLQVRAKGRFSWLWSMSLQLTFFFTCCVSYNHLRIHVKRGP